MSWTDLAACKGRDWHLWFPKRGDSLSVKIAKTVCRGCPVRLECLHEALEAPFVAVGIWGGTTEHERQRPTRTWRAS